LHCIRTFIPYPRDTKPYSTALYTEERFIYLAILFFAATTTETVLQYTVYDTAFIHRLLYTYILYTNIALLLRVRVLHRIRTSILYRSTATRTRTSTSTPSTLRYEYQYRCEASTSYCIVYVRVRIWQSHTLRHTKTRYCTYSYSENESTDCDSDSNRSGDEWHLEEISEDAKQVLVRVRVPHHIRSYDHPSRSQREAY